MSKVTSITRDLLPADLAGWITEQQDAIRGLILVAEMNDEDGTTVIKTAQSSNLDVAWAVVALLAVLTDHIKNIET
jgi:hypothetical protein